MFVRNVDGTHIQRWCDNLTGKRGLAENTAVRHFNVMHHLMKKASTIWSKETGLTQNPADMIEIKRSDDSRERFLSKEELKRLKVALDERMFREGTKDFNQKNLRMRLIVLIAISTGMRSTEIHNLRWLDVMYRERLIAVRAKLKKGIRALRIYFWREDVWIDFDRICKRQFEGGLGQDVNQSDHSAYTSDRE